MTTFFVRADGTAANKEAATGPASDASKAMNAAVFVSESFLAGDIIEVHESFGNIPQIILVGGNVTGTSGTPVLLQFQKQATLTRSTAGPILQLTGTTDWLTVSGLSAENSSIVTANGTVVLLSGSVGAASDESVKLIDCDIPQNPTGDGFGQDSAGSGHVEYIRCNPTNCGTSEPTAGHQGFTGHAAAQSAIMTDCDIAGCAEGLTFVGGATAVMNGGSITATTNKLTKADNSGSSVILNDVTITANTPTARLADVSAGALVEWNNCITSITDHSASDTFISGQFNITGGSLLVDSPAATMQALSGGEIILSRVTLDVDDCERFLRTATGGVARLLGGSVDCSDLGTGTTDVVVYFSSGGDGEVTGVVWDELGGLRERVQVVAGASSDIRVSNNTVVNSISGGRFLNDAVGVSLNNNIFSNVSDVSSGIGPANTDNNCYFNSENLGGSGSITDDPLFVNAIAGNFSILGGSPCAGTGKELTNAPLDSVGNSYLTPPNMGAIAALARGSFGRSILRGSFSKSITTSIIR